MNLRISGMSSAPMKPMVPVFDAMAASMPTRKDPSCSLKVTDWTFGASTTASTRVKRTAGCFGARLASGAA